MRYINLRLTYLLITMPWQDVCPSVCLSVRLSVRLTPVLSLNGSTYPQSLFTIGYSPAILVFPYQTGWQYSDGDPLRGSQMQGGMKKSRFSTNIGLYLGTDAR